MTAGAYRLIRYLAENYAVPSVPNRGWEYPQQPLYYIITATIYKLFNGDLNYIGYFSIILFNSIFNILI